MKIEILRQARLDLVQGYYFYESQKAGLGSVFLTNLYSDIESLRLNAGIHLKPYKSYHRLLSHRFPFAVFYKIVEQTVIIYAVLDCRRDPDWIKKRLK